MRAGLGRNVLASLANAGTGIGIALLTTPLILHAVGTAGYGVWTLTTAFVLYLAIAEAGIGPAAQRFVAVAHGRGDLGGAARILWTSVALYALVGAVVCVALVLLAEPIIGLFDIPAQLEGDGARLLRLVGPALLLGLVAIAIGNVQQGLERFTAVAAATAAGSVVYLGAIAVLVAGDAGLDELGYALVLQQAVFVVLRLATVRDVLATGPPRFVSRSELSELVAFSAKLQVSVLSLLINGQSDKVVVGLVAPAATVGQLGIATQASEAGRLVGAAGLVPMISRLSAHAGARDEPRLVAEYERLNRLWLIAVIGATTIAAATLHPLISGWLGDGYGEAVLLGEFLVVAYGVSLLPGTRIAYLRATNRVGLEAQLGAVTIALNILFTVPLALAFGARGVVAGTLAAYVLGVVFFLWRFERVAPAARATPASALLRAAGIGLALGALALGWGMAMLALLPSGFALVPIVAGVLVALIAYLGAALGVRPTPSRLAAALGEAPPSRG